MRIWYSCLLVWLGLPIWANPVGPLEQPPEDFASAQYIDSAGCVYLRQGAVWAPRLDRDGTLICGYPPSLPAGSRVAETADHAALKLSLTLAEGLQDADLREDPNDPLRRAPVETPKANGQRMAGLGASVQALPAMRAATAGNAAGDQYLCDLLGYQASSGGGGGEGATLGICANGGAALTSKVVRDVDDKAAADAKRRIATAPSTGGPNAAGGGSTGPSARPDQANGQGSSGGAKARPLAGQSGAKDIASKTDGPEMVPAAARYVQIGRFGASAADEVIRRLAGLGYPLVRSTREDPKTKERLIMAGPFADRQAVIAALSQLRGAGYPGAFAR